MKNLLCFSVASCFLLLAASTFSSQQAAPQPGPEHEKLSYFVGTWTSEGETKASAFGPAGKYTFTEICDWLPGKFAVACKENGTMLGGEVHATSVMTYDTGEKSYVYFESNNWGEVIYAHGAVDGDTWTWNSESKMNGQTIHGRFTLKRVSPDLATFSYAMATGSDALATIMTGKQTRQK
jgi:Protein of unknown function (DUF1579)